MKKKNTLKIGSLGEDIVCKFLENKGFTVVGRNYRKKWGEIDIIARKLKTLHFIEVKAVKFNSKEAQNPEENVHEKKLKRLFRTIQTYLSEKNEEEIDWQLDVAAVFLDLGKKTARVRMTENAVME